MTTIETVTDEQIRALETASGEAGDHLMAAVCLRALGRALDGEDIRDIPLSSGERDLLATRWASVEAARTECVRVIRAAEAMAD